MRLPVLSAALLSAMASSSALSQTTPPVDPSAQPHKEWELTRRSSVDLTKRDGTIDDARILPYLQQLTDRLTNSAGIDSIQVRLTRSPSQYAAILPNRVLSISAGMLGRIDDEAELSGLIAHEFAHLALHSFCVLDPLRAPSPPQDLRDGERQATTLAVSTLKTAGYDPTSMLGLLSKLSYEHPAWSKAIASEDLLDLRAHLETEVMPPAGYRLDSSAFVQAHNALVSMRPKVVE